MRIKGLMNNIFLPAPVLSVNKLIYHLKGGISRFFAPGGAAKMSVYPYICPYVDAGTISNVPKTSLF
jgi:hypothetical protein